MVVFDHIIPLWDGHCKNALSQRKSKIEAEILRRETERKIKIENENGPVPHPRRSPRKPKPKIKSEAKPKIKSEAKPNFTSSSSHDDYYTPDLIDDLSQSFSSARINE